MPDSGFGAVLVNCDRRLTYSQRHCEAIRHKWTFKGRDVRTSTCWSYVNWYNECSGGNWATWEPGEAVAPGDLGHFDKNLRFHSWSTLANYNIEYKASREGREPTRFYASGDDLHLETKAKGE